MMSSVTLLFISLVVFTKHCLVRVSKVHSSHILYIGHPHVVHAGIRGRGGGVISPNIWWGGPARNEKWTKWDLRFCKNEGSKRCNNTEKGGQQDGNSRRKLVQIASKVSNDRFL